jgi:hypothetical protein
MAYEGYVDIVNDREIVGWVYDDANENQPLTVEIFAGGRIVAKIRADEFRADLKAAGKGNGQHAFRYALGGGSPEGALSARLPGKRWSLQPTQNATGRPPPLQQDPRRKFLHTLEFGYPEMKTAFTVATSSPGELTVVGRVIDAFHRAVKDDPDDRSKKSDMWSDIRSSQHREVLDLVKRRDSAALADYLRDAHAKGLTVGITQGVEMTSALRANPDARRAVGTEYADNLVSLAEFLGILDVESPDQRGHRGENLHADPQALVDGIASKAGFPIETPPVVGSYFGLETRGGVLSGRDICSLYAAIRLREIAADIGVSSPRVCEIGGGLGGVAYYCGRMGIDFTIIDLPLVGLLQGYFLLRSLPGFDIQLYGEPESAMTAIRLMPTFCFHASGREYDILLNQDSFPEMNQAYSLGYLKEAGGNVRHAFYSINQEARAIQSGTARQTVVRELVERAGGFRRSSRFRHWLRAGYMEEVFRKSGGSGARSFAGR